MDKCKFVTCHEADTRGVLNDSNVKILERDFFGDQIAKGIIDPRASYLMTCELKYDGVSVEADCTDIVVSARSRGDTGIGEATFANAKGYKLVIVIQPGVSKERSQILKALGATLLQVTDVPGFPELLTNGLSMEGLDRVFKAFAKQNGWYYLNQAGDINNSLAHVKTTGPEIWEATGGKVDYVVQLVGTGGTLSGLAKYFREKNPDVKIIGAQPAEQSKKNPAFPDRNTIDGVLNFNGVPAQNYPPLLASFDTKWDECFDVVAEDGYETGRKLVATEGFFVGQSAGAALWVATQIAKRPETAGKNIVVILADNAFKYLSTNMYK